MCAGDTLNWTENLNHKQVKVRLRPHAEINVCIKQLLENSSSYTFHRYDAWMHHWYWIIFLLVIFFLLAKQMISMSLFNFDHNILIFGCYFEKLLSRKFLQPSGEIRFRLCRQYQSMNDFDCVKLYSLLIVLTYTCLMQFEKIMIKAKCVKQITTTLVSLDKKGTHLWKRQSMLNNIWKHM